jgi:hypothetical protein
VVAPALPNWLAQKPVPIDKGEPHYQLMSSLPRETYPRLRLLAFLTKIFYNIQHIAYFAGLVRQKREQRTMKYFPRFLSITNPAPMDGYCTHLIKHIIVKLLYYSVCILGSCYQNNFIKWYYF